MVRPLCADYVCTMWAYDATQHGRMKAMGPHCAPMRPVCARYVSTPVRRGSDDSRGADDVPTMRPVCAHYVSKPYRGDHVRTACPVYEFQLSLLYVTLSPLGARGIATTSE